MVTVTNIRNIDCAAHDEVWAIVRSLRYPGKMRHVPELSPSWALFKQYLTLRDTGKWNNDSFNNIYVPVFLKEMQTATARKKLTEIVEMDKQGKRICLACFCDDEAMCHRSIVAGILQYAGITVQGVKGDYSSYGKEFFKK